MFYLVKDTQIKASYITLDAPVNGFKVVRIPTEVKIDEEDPSPALFDADSMVNQKYSFMLVNDPSFDFVVFDEIGFEEPDVNEDPASQVPFDLGSASGGVGSGDSTYFLQAVPVYATAYLDFTLSPTDTSTITIDGKTYTFQTVLTDVDGNVEIGGTDAETLTNLINAINLSGTPGTGYAASTTVHPTVRAEEASGTLIAMRVYAKTAGTAANTIAVSTTVGGATWDNATLTGGAASSASLDSTTIDVSADGVFDRVKVWWDVYSLSRTYDGNRTIIRHTAELPEMVNASISNNGGATFTPVAHMTPLTLAAPGSQMVLRFENTSQNRYYIGSFAILY